jgi:beta-galactosidase
VHPLFNAQMTVPPLKMRLGVCYYPEHWPEDWWADDAAQMVAMGLSRVRIGEFAWSRIEPEPGRFDWAWLDRAVDVLHAAGLGIIMGTPTATPPKWLVDQTPDMIAVDARGCPRRFGSRRHYCFSHLGYRAEAARITAAMAARYGAHPAIVAWQTDNEYGCHDTVLSYSDSAAAAFRLWLAAKYGDVGALNAAWGNVFWSMDYRSFDEVGLPNLTVTEPNPAHVLDYRRFASDEVVTFNRAQVDILRAASPGRDIVHNYMGFFTQFDHHAVSRDLDVATWDSYPLGFLEQFWFPAADKLTYANTGHPDIAAFHHDLYRGCAKGRWWVMEQQPGPVNWARFNPAPLPGMVRLWTLEAMAHGAELVSYFRWRQVPFAQEQMHAGLLLPDRSDDVGAGEVRTVAAEIEALMPAVEAKDHVRVALIFSYEAAWVIETQPQGASFNYLELCFNFYTSLRKLGLNVDIIAPGVALEGYAMVVVPCLPIVCNAFVEQLSRFDGPVVIGPRSGSKTTDFKIPDALSPGPLQQILPIRITRVESLRPGPPPTGLTSFTYERWFEHVTGDAEVDIVNKDGRAVVLHKDNVTYLAAWPALDSLGGLLAEIAQKAGLSVDSLPEGLRLRRFGRLCFAFNYGSRQRNLSDFFAGAATRTYLIGGIVVEPAGVAVWQEAEL